MCSIEFSLKKRYGSYYKYILIYNNNNNYFECSVHQRFLMVFHSSLSDISSLHVQFIKYFSLKCLQSSAYFQVLQSLYQFFGGSTKGTDYFHIQYFSISLARSRDLSFFSLFFSFILGSAGTAMSIIWLILFFRLLSLRLVIWLILGDSFVP